MVIRPFNGVSPKIASSAFISEAAYVIGSVEIGEDSSVWPGAVLRGDFGKIMVGRGTILEDNCVVHGAADLSIGNEVIIGHGAVVHCLSIGDRVLVGNNATLLDGAVIGNRCIIGAGSLVPPGTRVPDGSMAVGVPVRIKGPLSPEQVRRLERGAADYGELARKYKREGL
jgi:carbonic anhydrase/acetyltransferase-like protein (isoleucine patch superfamily)